MLEPVENRYSKDTWRISKLLARAGFMASRVAAPTEPEPAQKLWKESMKMAVTSWLSSSAHDSLAEVTYGLCHLAAGPIPVSDEPSATLSYFRGEPDLVARAVVALHANGLDAKSIIQAGDQGGVDIICHLDLAKNLGRAQAFDDELKKFRKAADIHSSAAANEIVP